MTPTARASRPSLEEVATAAGVSRATVSRVINGVASVDPGLRSRVDRAVQELGYRPNMAARALVTRRSDTLALVAFEPDIRVFGDPFFGAIVRGVTSEANAAGQNVVLLMAQGTEDLQRTQRFVESSTAEGVLLVSEHAGAGPLSEALEEAGIPVVIGGRPHSSRAHLPFVDNDNVTGARLATRRLIETGRRRIATLAGPADMTAGADRLEGFRAELGDLFDERLVERGDFTQAGGERAAARLLARAPDVDGIFAASDLTALGAMAVLARDGRRVPDDVAVVGFDDIELAASATPPLTTVRQHTLLQGRTMVRLLLARTRPGLPPSADPAMPPTEGVDHVVLPVELVVRSSG